MSSISASATEDDRALSSPVRLFASVLSAAVEIAAAKLEKKVAEWTDGLQDAAGGDDPAGALVPLADEGLDALGEGGAVQKVGAEGVKAGLHGKNPIWGALKGAWQSATPAVRSAIVAAAVSIILLVVLSPVLAVIFALSFLVFAAVHRARAGKS